MNGESSQPVIVLDALANIAVPQEPFHNELGAIRRLLVGMETLYRFVADQEQRAQRVLGWNSSGIGNLPGLAEAGVNREILACAFDWYAINASRAFGLIGYLGGKAGMVVEVDDYQGKTCGSLLLYRNKIAAHYAIVDPKLKGRNRDNPADLALSVMEPISYAEGRFITGGWGFAMGNANEHHQSQHDITFSVTEFQEQRVVPRKILTPAS